MCWPSIQVEQGPRNLIPTGIGNDRHGRVTMYHISLTFSEIDSQSLRNIAVYQKLHTYVRTDFYHAYVDPRTAS